MAKSSTKQQKTPRQKLQKRSLVATRTRLSNAVDVTFLFTAGIGQVTASLFRNGVLINMQSISSSGSIHFTDVQRSDGIAINGVCTGNCRITISANTRPGTPENFQAGIILTGYQII